MSTGYPLDSAQVSITNGPVFYYEAETQDPCFDNCSITFNLGPFALNSVVGQVTNLTAGLYFIRATLAVGGAAVPTTYPIILETSRDNLTFEPIGVMAAGNGVGVDRLNIMCQLKVQGPGPGAVIRMRCVLAGVAADNFQSCIQTKRISR